MARGRKSFIAAIRDPDDSVYPCFPSFFLDKTVLWKIRSSLEKGEPEFDYSTDTI